jgi:hypothetical protein
MRHVAALCFLPVVVGCGGSQMMSTDPPPPANGLQLEAGPYDVAAGSEKYFCFATTLNEAAGVAVTKFDVFNGASVHHMALFKTLAPEPEGFTECPVLIKQTWLPLVAGGRNTTGLTLPAGAGFQLGARDQVLIQLHLLNATSDARPGEKTFVNMTYADNPSAITPAGIYALGSMTIDIPAGSNGYTVTSSCNVTHPPLNLFAAFPHMHQIGTSITLERGTSATDAKMIYQRNPWVFGDQPMDPLPLTINTGDFLRATCTYNNPGATDVVYGESSMNEMCYMVLFYTPYDHLDGCIN